MSISFEKKFSLIFLLIALSVFAFSIIAFQNNKSIADSNYLVNHTHQVLYSTEKVLSALKDIETGARGYIITGDTSFLAPYHQSKDSIVSNIQKLEVLTKDNAGQQSRIDSLYALAIKRIEQCTLISKKKPADLKNTAELLLLVREGKVVMDKIRKSIGAIEWEESRLLTLREDINNENYEIIKRRIYLIVSILLSVFVLGYIIMRYNFSVMNQDSKLLFQLNKKVRFLSQRFDDTIEAISDPFFALDKNWKFIYINSAAQRKMNINKAGSIGKDIFKLFPGYKKSVVGQNMIGVQQNQVQTSFEVYDEIYEQWQDFTIYPTIEGVTVYIKNATARKANEAELLKTKQFLEETNEVAHIGGWEIDISKNSVYWTTVTKLIHEAGHGYQPDLTSGLNFYKEGYNRDTILKSVNEAMSKGTGWNEELQIITVKGNERWIRTIGKPEFSNGECVRLVGTFQDIDDQKKLENKLKQSEKQFRSSFEHSAIGMALVTSNGKWKEVNESLCKSLGYTQEELFKLTFKDITHPDDLQADLILLQELVEGKRQSYQLEKRYFHKDGHIVWIFLVVSMVKDTDGNIVHFIAQIQDISEKKEAEVKLLEERQLLKTIIDNLPINVYLKDLHSRKTLINRSELEYMGAKNEDEILGKNDFDLYPDDTALISLQEDQEVFKTGKSIIDRETVSFKKNGRETWFLTSKIPFRNTHNEMIGLLGISYDITTRNQIKKDLEASEQKLSTLFDLSPVGFVLSDHRSGNFLEFNHSFIKALGYTREELNNLHYKDITPVEYWDKALQIQESVTEKGYFGPLEKEYIKKDGSRFPALLNGLTITDAGGRELIWIVVQDITELKLKEKELLYLNISIEDRNRELAIKNEELEQFAYVASHDLQEPLRMITGFLSKIEKKYHALLDEDGKRYINFAVDGAVRMRNLITDILNYSSLGNNTESKVTPVDLNGMVTDIIKNLVVSQNGKTAVVDADELPVVNAEKISMQQLFTNLVGNAIKYQKAENKPIVKIKVEDKTDHWKFSVADNGIGIDQKSFHKVFNVFQRLHTKDEYAGTGIGLAICKKIVNNMRGEIWLESEPGQGTTFYFTIRK